MGKDVGIYTYPSLLDCEYDLFDSRYVILSIKEGG